MRQFPEGKSHFMILSISSHLSAPQVPAGPSERSSHSLINLKDCVAELGDAMVGDSMGIGAGAEFTCNFRIKLVQKWFVAWCY